MKTFSEMSIGNQQSKSLYNDNDSSGVKEDSGGPIRTRIFYMQEFMQAHKLRKSNKI